MFAGIAISLTLSNYLLWPQFNHIPIHHERAAELGNMPKNQASKQKHEMGNELNQEL